VTPEPTRPARGPHAATPRPVRILVEPSDYVLRNVGDMAMLSVAVTRLRGMWPGAEILVLTDTPEDLDRFCPTATPLPSDGRRAWFSGVLPGARLSRLLPGPVASARRNLDDSLRRRWPGLAAAALRRKLRRGAGGSRALDAFLEAVSGADLVVVSGMGGITDAFPDYALKVLDTLGLAIRSGTRTAMVGQGMGPIDDPRLRRRAREILPGVDFIGLREGLAGGPLLRSLGVPAGRVMTTGDDAIEMAYEDRPGRLGDGIGVNLRTSAYSGVGQGALGHVRDALTEASRKSGGRLIPVPISSVPGEADAETIARLLEGSGGGTDGGAALVTPAQVVRQICHCRVVVTGSYHAAVFALSMGVSAVGLAKSAYYVNKFQGLADQFGPGCTVVPLGDEVPARQVSEAVERAWTSAEANRPPLLASASKQIQLGHAAYRRIYDIVGP